jgi:hypothetical protein
MGVPSKRKKTKEGMMKGRNGRERKDNEEMKMTLPDHLSPNPARQPACKVRTPEACKADL